MVRFIFCCPETSLFPDSTPHPSVGENAERMSQNNSQRKLSAFISNRYSVVITNLRPTTSFLRTLLITVLVCSVLNASIAGGKDWSSDKCTASEKVTINEAITAVEGTSQLSDVRELLDQHLQLRGERVPESDKPKYWQELKVKPELRNTLIYDAGSKQSQAILKKLRPVLALFQRDWDVAVIKQDAPFSGLFRQCIYIISTGLLEMIEEEQLIGFAAHELAHECFIEELREADRLDCVTAHHLVEYKCDLVAATACLILKNNPQALLSGVARVETYYQRNNPSVLVENSHPTAKQRHHCMEIFLDRIVAAKVAER